MKTFSFRGWKPALPWTLTAWRPSILEESGFARHTSVHTTYSKATERARELVLKGWDGAEVQEHA